MSRSVVSRRFSKSRLLLLLLACAAVASSVLAPAAQARPALGVNVASPFDGAQLAEVEALGAERVRTFVLANVVQPSAGGPLNAYMMGGYTAFVNRMSARGIKVDFVVVGSPGGGGPTTPPPSSAAYASFLAQFASHFPNKGVAYEIWNEEDEAIWWGPAPNAAAYADLVKKTYPAVKGVDPSAVIVLGPTTGNNYLWLEQLYDHGIKGSFDVAAVHTDTACLVAAPSEFYRENNRIGRFSFLGYKEVRASMLARGDNKPIWMTEFGWSSTGYQPNSCRRGAKAGTKPSGVTEEMQSEFLTQAVRCMSHDPYVEMATWWTIRDDPGQPEPELRTYGLIRPGGAHKPAWDQMAGLIRGSIASTGPCADLSGPAIKIQKPTHKQKFRGVLKVKITALDPSGIKYVRYYNGTKVITAIAKNNLINAGKPISMRWWGAQCLKKGNYRIKVVAVDRLGNKSYAKVLVKKTTAAKKMGSCKKAKKRK